MDGKKILLTGGSGAVGSALVARLQAQYPGIHTVTVLSNNEQEQFAMSARLSPKEHPVRYLMADVRDRDRMMMACRGIDVVIHAAAMKHVPVSELHPLECTLTNVLGSQNVIDAAITNGVERVIALSTDKAVAPINAYGASKLLLERLFLRADLASDTRFSVVRYANVFGSSGSVVPVFLSHRAKGFLPVTHPEMTRFSITMQEGIDVIFHAMHKAWGGEVYIPIAPSYRIVDVAQAIAPDAELRIVGKRPGEKLHECMLTAEEASSTVRLNDRYIICPNPGRWTAQRFCDETGATTVPPDFKYDSSANTEWLSVEKIREMAQYLPRVV